MGKYTVQEIQREEHNKRYIENSVWLPKASKGEIMGMLSV